MWVFAFGSLMADGWENQFNSIARSAARLDGYRRSFGKFSVGNWGTKKHPGVTLILEPAAEAVCHGVAFEFEGQAMSDAMRQYLRGREACDPTLLPLELTDGQRVNAHAYVYAGKNLLPAGTTLDEKVAIILKSERGEKGTGVDYVRNAFADLEVAGVDDPVVTELWDAVQRAVQAG